MVIPLVICNINANRVIQNLKKNHYLIFTFSMWTFTISSYTCLVPTVPVKNTIHKISSCVSQKRLTYNPRESRLEHFYNWNFLPTTNCNFPGGPSYDVIIVKAFNAERLQRLVYWRLDEIVWINWNDLTGNGNFHKYYGK